MIVGLQNTLTVLCARNSAGAITSAFEGAFDGWVQDVPGTFSATDNYLKNTVSTATVKMRRDTANAEKRGSRV